MGRPVERSLERPLEPDRASGRPVVALGLLLVLEIASLAALGGYELLGVDWRRVWSGVVRAGAAPSPEVVEALAFVLFVPPAALMLLAALSFLFLRRRGWLLAAISQGSSVAVCLYLYSEFRPVYVYPIMAYGVLMILYLNVHDVRAIFHREPGRERLPR